MAAGDHLNRYAEGWTTGDLDAVLESLDSTYEIDDPNFGKVSKAAFADYFNGFKPIVAEMRDGSAPTLIDLSEIVTQQEGDVLTA